MGMTDEKERIFSVAAYIRLSREDGDREESDSVGNQRRLLQQFLEGREDLCLYDFYIDDGFSGTSFQRTAFLRMLGDIEAGVVDCVAVKDLSRFGRDYIETGRYLERYFPELGVRFLSLSDGIDSLKQPYDMLLPIKNIFNEQYARDISGKIHATLSAKQKAGAFIGAFSCYGYRKSPLDKNRLIIDEYPASVVRRIFSLYLQGYGKQRIASLLNSEGVPCPAAYKQALGMKYQNPRILPGVACWSYSAVNSILHREMYVGNMVQGTRRQHMRGRQKAVKREQWIVVENTHEPIIDRETWEKTQRLLAGRTKSVEFHSRRNPFTGLVRCGDCGGAMARNTWRRADGSRVCSLYCGVYPRNGRQFCSPHMVPLRLLEELVAEDLKTLLANAEAICGQSLDTMMKNQMLFRDPRKQKNMAGQRTIDERKNITAPQPITDPKELSSQKKTQKKNIRQELALVRKRKQSLYEDYQDRLISRDDYLAYRRDYQQKENVLSMQLKLLEQEKDSDPKGAKPESEPEPVTGEQFLARIQPELLTRELAAGLIAGITVYEPNRIQITYRFS